MYQSSLRNSKVFQPIIPVGVPITQSYIPPTPQVSPVAVAPQILVPQVQQVPQVTTVPQVQQVTTVPQVQQVSMVPQIQTAIPTVPNLYPTQTTYASFIPQLTTQTSAPQLVPYAQPLGSRLPYVQNHLGQIPNQTNFNNIGGSIYGRVSIIH